jgi:molybdate transport system substrate-binding protein
VVKTAWIIAAAKLAATGVVLASGMAQAAEIKVLSSAAFREAYQELVPAFERATEHKVATTWAGTNGIMERMQRGEATDLVIMSAQGIDQLVQDGKIVAGSRVDVARSGVGVAVRSGLPKPDIGSTEALKRALAAARSVAYSTGPSGVYMEALFQRLGIADEIKPKLKVAPSGTPVGTLIASGEADIGFQQVSELLPVAGIDYIGPLPPDIQQITVFAAGLHTSAKETEAAKALVKFLTAPQAAPVIRKKGMEPG